MTLQRSDRRNINGQKTMSKRVLKKENLILGRALILGAEFVTLCFSKVATVLGISNEFCLSLLIFGLLGL